MNYKDSFSGSKFELFEKNNEQLYIKKFYKKINKRDVQSFIKQKNFQSYFIDSYKIESAHIKNFEKKKKYIVLKYYNGLSGSDLILSSDTEMHKVLNIFLKRYINNLIISSKREAFNKRSYLLKCKEIQKKTLPKHMHLYKKIFRKIYLKLDNVKFNLRGSCHGDLTLSNIIINNESKKIILIDFLKTYNESPLQDICKLIQDLRLYWSSRRFNKTDMLRAKIFCDNLNPFSLLKKHSLYKIIEIEMLMTLLRILPYVPINDIETLKWIDNSFKKLNFNFLKKI